jgi:D-threo-aldose 1-dehydrogenase
VNSTPLGRSGVVITRLMFGSGPIGGLFSAVGDQASEETLVEAWEAGVRAFDTAPHYGTGLAERRLGSFLADKPRDQVVVSTKVGRLLVPAERSVEGDEAFYGALPFERVWDFSRDGVLRSLEGSLERLGLDRVDIALVHDPDDFYEEALGQAYPALEELRAQGAVRAIGFGMNQVEMLERFVAETDLDCLLVAGRFTLLDRSAERGLLPACAERGVGVLVGGAFNSGVLADPRPGATYDYKPASDEVRETALRLAEVCRARGVPLGAAALQFPLRSPAVSAVVVGARSAAQMSADASDFGRQIPDELWQELEEARLGG